MFTAARVAHDQGIGCSAAEGAYSGGHSKARLAAGRAALIRRHGLQHRAKLGGGKGSLATEKRASGAAGNGKVRLAGIVVLWHTWFCSLRVSARGRVSGGKRPAGCDRPAPEQEGTGAGGLNPLNHISPRYDESAVINGVAPGTVRSLHDSPRRPKTVVKWVWTARLPLCSA